MSLEELCNGLARRHRLSREETLSMVTAALSDSLTRALGRRVIFCIDGELLLIFKVVGEDSIREIDFRSVRRSVLRLFNIRLGEELMKRKAMDEHEYLTGLQGTVVRGVVERILDDGSLLVLIHIEEILTCRELFAFCPLYCQPLHERGRFVKGDARFFHVSSVSLVRMRGVYRNEVRLSRTTPRLTEVLLARESGMTGIRCVRRIAGRMSMVVSTAKIPRTAVKAVGKELGERIIVRWRSSKRTASGKKTGRKPTWG